MKAITICQPYASLIASGAKRVENRGWATHYRGAIAIHAGKSRAWLKSWDGPTPDPMPFGAVVAVANLAACLSIEEIRSGQYDERFPWLRDHLHAEGPFCWVLTEITALAEPIPANGSQGFWHMPDRLLGLTRV